MRTLQLDQLKPCRPPVDVVVTAASNADAGGRGEGSAGIAEAAGPYVKPHGALVHCLLPSGGGRGMVLCGGHPVPAQRTCGAGLSPRCTAALLWRRLPQATLCRASPRRAPLPPPPLNTA